MRKLFWTLVALCVCSVAYGQATQQVYSRIRDATNTVAVSAVGQLTLTMPVTTYALAVASGVYYYDGVNLRRWSGSTLGSDNVVATTYAPYSMAFGYSYDGAAWDRITSTTAADNLSSTQQGLNTLSYNLFYNGTNYQRWTGVATHADAVPKTTPSPWVGNFNYVLHGVTWDMQTASTSADNLSATPQGIDSISYTHFFSSDGVPAFRRWTGLVTQVDALTNATAAPFVANLSYVLHGSTWDRMTAITSADNISATPQGLEVIDYMHYFNGTNHQRWTGETWDSGLAITNAPPVIALSSFYNGSNGQYLQGSKLDGETVANSTYAPHGKNFLYGYDATAATWRWINAADSQADGKATTLNALDTTSFLYAYNAGSAAFNMLRLGAYNELYVTDVAVRPGEDPANDFVKVKIDAVGTTAPDATVGTAVTGGAGLTIVLASRDVSQDINWCIYLKNTDGVDPFTNAEVETSPDNAVFSSLGWFSCDTLAAGAVCNFCTSGSAYKYVRARVASANDVTVTSYFFGNRN
jgi:hypothetical protein